MTVDSKSKKIAFISMLTAIICVISPFSLPLGEIPTSLSIMAILVVCGLGGIYGSIATVIYIMIGIVGVPVFSGFVGGFGVVLGYTGGFILGYIPLAFIVGITSNKIKNSYFNILFMCLGVTTCYFIGTLYYSILTKTPFLVALLVCVVPFVVIDVIKIIIAFLIIKAIKIRVL